MLDALYRIIVLDYISHHKLVEAKSRAERKGNSFCFSGRQLRDNTTLLKRKRKRLTLSCLLLVLFFYFAYVPCSPPNFYILISGNTRVRIVPQIRFVFSHLVEYAC